MLFGLVGGEVEKADGIKEPDIANGSDIACRSRVFEFVLFGSGSMICMKKKSCLAVPRGTRSVNMNNQKEHAYTLHIVLNRRTRFEKGFGFPFIPTPLSDANLQQNHSCFCLRNPAPNIAHTVRTQNLHTLTLSHPQPISP